MSPRDWDAATYDRVSRPQLEWGLRVLERLPLVGDERVLDAGCGSGRVTAQLAERLPRGQVVAVDASADMVARARQALPDSAQVIQADLLELDLDEPVDAVFSTATFHWILDHARLFTRLRALLRPDGLLVAQCGGEGNVTRFLGVAERVAGRQPYADHLSNMVPSWHFAHPRDTEALLAAAGFEDVRCWLSDAPTTLAEPIPFLTTVCCGVHLELLPAELHERFVADVLAELGDQPVIDYVRLEIDARAAG